MKINFKQPLTNLEGKVIEENMGKVLSQALAQLNKGESVKIWAWALSLYKGESLELDKVDFGVLRGLIEASEALTILAKAQLLTTMDEAQASYEKKSKP